MNYADAVADLTAIYEQRVADALRELLECKHLYQSVQVKLGVITNFEAAAKAPKERAGNALDLAAGLQDGPWSIFGSQTGIVDYSVRGVPAGVKLAKRLQVRAPDLKLYCAAPCKRLEPFHATDCTHVFSGEKSKPTRQIFVLCYVCQSCKGEPTVFLVRREGLKLTLAGRSPIEHVNVPREIPRQVAKYYSGAVVAHQSGQTLAGNFLLRTLVEQWVRSFPPAAEMRAEEALDWYYRNLPEDFSQRFPSLRSIYEKLSSDIHAAGGDAKVFSDESARIVKHFDAWRVYELNHATFGQSRRDSD
ncbi:MAG TPA: hypothetical protein VF756_07080 [Thermoanaerobaculia bacterium]